MSDTHHEEQPLPRLILWGAAALLVGSIAAVMIARYSDTGVTHMPPASVVEQRLLRFDDRDDGAVVIHDAANAEQVQVLAPGTHGFVRGVMRGMARDRRRAGLDSVTPFELTRWSDGRMSITDPTTQVTINLEVFGPTNAADFRQLLASDHGA